MRRGVPHLVQVATQIYHENGLGQLVGRSQQYVRRTLHDAIRQNSIIRGERQFYFYTVLRYRLQQRRYTAPADPYGPIWIDPSEVEYMNSEISKEWGLGQIKAGDWDTDKHCWPNDESPIYKGIKQRFEEEYAWEDTAYYKHAENEFEKRGSLWGYDSLEQFRQVRCQYVTELFETIRDEGYRPNFEAGHHVPEADERNTTLSFCQRLEPLVTIGRNGDIYWRTGRHRAAIAEVLGIGSIPVNVMARHRQWQQVREDVCKADNPSEVGPNLTQQLDHPDLRDVVEGPLAVVQTRDASVD